MEKDDEVKGEGNSYTTEFRQLDPRVGRWLTVDPEFEHFPWQSPFASFDNNPLINNDPNGGSAQNQTSNPGKRIIKLTSKIEKAHEKGLDKREERLIIKRARLLNDSRNMEKENKSISLHNWFVFGKGGSDHVESTLGSEREVATPEEESGPFNAIGFKAARIDPSGKLDVFQVGKANPAYPRIPFWPIGNGYGQPPGNQVLVDANGNIIDPKGKILIPVLNGVDPSDGLYESGETVYSTGSTVTEDTIQRLETITKYDSNGYIKSVSGKKSRNITKTVEKLN